MFCPFTVPDSFKTISASMYRPFHTIWHHFNDFLWNKSLHSTSYTAAMITKVPNRKFSISETLAR